MAENEKTILLPKKITLFFFFLPNGHSLSVTNRGKTYTDWNSSRKYTLVMKLGNFNFKIYKKNATNVGISFKIE